MELDYVSLGKRIKETRLKADMTQEELAEKSCLSITHMSNIETGNARVSLRTLVGIASALSVSMDDLLCDSVVRATPQIRGDIASLLADCDEYEIRVIRDTVGELKASLRRVQRLRKENEL